MTELDFGDLDRLIELQERLGLKDTHLVELAPNGFSIAHTDEEREELDDLVDCPLHYWLSSGKPEQELGIYIVRNAPKSPLLPDYADPWEFEPIQ
jgi:hypothetical protein